MITLQKTNSENVDFQNLVALLDAELKIRDGDEHTFYDHFIKIDAIRWVVVAYINNVVVGCGAIKKYDGQKVELKRMFVKDECRGKGIAQRLLKTLEQWALELAFEECILEVGKKQPEAVRFYTNSGYDMMPNYGQYQNVENSVCMRKILNTKTD